MAASSFDVVMFPWIAAGHMTPFLHLSNKLAEKGFSITFLLPNKAIQQLQHLNLYPNLITFHALTIPHVDGLPEGTETASDISIHLNYFLSIAFDRTRHQVQNLIQSTKPKLVFYDAAHWVPEITKPLGIKAVKYVVVSAAAIAIGIVPARNVCKDKPITEAEISVPPIGYPSSTILFRGSEARSLLFISQPFGEGLTFYERISTALKESDAIAIRTCYETEGMLCDYIGSQYRKPIFLTGPVLPAPSNTPLEDRWEKWLSGFEKGSVVFCAFGSQIILEKDQFQELVLGFEATGLPFLVALKPPTGASTIEEALPDGFQERVKGRGAVWGGWVQQLKILDHPSVGCFVSHCGFGSMWEALTSDCQIVLVPNLADQILNARLLVDELKVAVEVERDETGWFSKENLSNSIELVMDKDSEVASTLNKNHAKWREIFGSPGFIGTYVDNFVKNIQELAS